MWEFFSDVLREGGVIALLFTACSAAFALTARALWSENQLLHRQMRENAEESTRLVRQLQEELSRQIHELQEKRVVEAQQVTERVVAHVQAVDRAMERISTSLDVLIDLSGGKGGRR